MAKKPPKKPTCSPDNRICVIGAGLGGLAMAIRLQAAGLPTTVIEAGDGPGGMASGLACVSPAHKAKLKGFSYDMLPGVIDDQAGLTALWRLADRDMAGDINLLPLSPLHRCIWPDGAHLTFAESPAAMAKEITRFAPGDLAGFEDIVALARASGLPVPSHSAGRRGLAHRLYSLMRRHGWRSYYGLAAAEIGSERLCQAVTALAVLAGGNPLRLGPQTGRGLALALDRGLAYPKGGFGQLGNAMAALFTRLGGSIRYGDAVQRLETYGNRISSVVCHSGWQQQCSAVVHGGDTMQLYRDLLGQNPHGQAMAKRIKSIPHGPSRFILHMAVAGTWPGIAHHSLLFGPRYRGWLTDLFDHGTLPPDGMFALYHPSLTDASLAPAGKSVFSAVMPVAHQGQLPLDWAQLAPLLEQRIITELGRRLIPDIEDRIISKFSISPPDFARDFGCWNGSLTGPQISRWPQPWGKFRQVDTVYGNLYLGGLGLAGQGLGGVLENAEHIAQMIIGGRK